MLQPGHPLTLMAVGQPHHLEVDFGDFSVTIALTDATDVGTFAQAINAEQNAFTFSAVIEDDGNGELDYSLKAVANSVGVVANAPTIKVIDAMVLLSLIVLQLVQAHH